MRERLEVGHAVSSRARVGRAVTCQNSEMTGGLGGATGKLRPSADGELLHGEARFRMLVEGVKDCALFLLDSQGRIESWNSGSEVTKGYLEHELIGEHFSILYASEAIAQGKPQQQLEIARTENRFEEECWLVQKDRIQFWANVTITPVRDRSEQVTGFALVMRDITERKYTEELVRSSELRLRSILDAAPDACISLDWQGQIIDWNRQAEAIFGWSRQVVIGRAVETMLLPIKYRAVFRRRLKRFQLTGRGLPLNRRIDLHAIHVHGHEFPVEVTLTALRADAGRDLCAFVRDVTEARKAQQRLRELPREILRAQETERKRMAREFHDGVSQTLASLKMRIQLLEQELNGSEIGIEAQLAEARSLASKALEEVRRISHNLMPPELEAFGLERALENLCCDFRLRTGVKLQFKGFGQLPELPSEVELPVYRIVQESFHNIEKYAAATWVTVLLNRKADALMLSVKDNGVGLERCKDGASKPHGIGHNSMRQRAASLGGACRIRSHPGQGTTVVVWIPLGSVGSNGKSIHENKEVNV